MSYQVPLIAFLGRPLGSILIINGATRRQWTRAILWAIVSLNAVKILMKNSEFIYVSIRCGSDFENCNLQTHVLDIKFVSTCEISLRRIPITVTS